MTRPDYTDISSAAAAWDATLNDNYDLLRESFPFPEYVDLATLIASRPPAQNEGCAAAVNTPSWIPYWCDGTNWVEWPAAVKLHAATHQDGGTDEIAVALPAAGGIPKADGGGELHMDWLPDMIGATGVSNGEKGAVPQPLIADQMSFLRGDGTWSSLVGGPREMFFEADFNGDDGNRRRRQIGPAADYNFNFFVPFDATSIQEVTLLGICSAGAAGPGRDIDLSSDYAAVGEDKATHQETDTTTVYDFTGLTDEIIEIDLTPVLSVLAAGDHVGVNVDHNGLGGAIEYLGVRLRYI